MSSFVSHLGDVLVAYSSFWIQPLEAIVMVCASLRSCLLMEALINGSP